MSKLDCIRDRFDEQDYLMRAYLPLVKLPGYARRIEPRLKVRRIVREIYEKSKIFGEEDKKLFKKRKNRVV